MKVKKQIRSISGIVPLAVMLKPHPCPHGKCIYCPSQPGIPESYTTTSPVALRAKDCGWDGEKEVRARLKILNIMGHSTDKVELIVMGGTFSAYPEDYQEDFIKKCFDGLNGKLSASLEEAQKVNETATHRCVGMCLETRPDYCKENHVNNFLRFGGTRIEIGVQTLDDEIQKITKRGHTTEDVVKATQLLKDSAFKVGYHIMIGLPGSNLEKDVETVKTLFSDPRFKPDNIKLYPTFVIKGTPLEKLYNIGEFKPYSTEEIIDTLRRIKEIVPSYVRIMRVMRDIPAEHIVSECRYSHLRDELRDVDCKCIRCREVGHAVHQGKEVGEVKLKKIEYEASGGKEIFLSFEDENGILVSLLRLRIPFKPFREEIKNAALIREVHTYGSMVCLGKKAEKNQWQHRGYGKKLIEEAEKIAKELGCEKMIVISAVGTREYFYKLGYKLDGPYVSKVL